jgi:hypothetical protein
MLQVHDDTGGWLSWGFSGYMDYAEEWPVFEFGTSAEVAFLSPGDTYYVGVITGSEAAADGSFTISCDPFSDDPYEENDALDPSNPELLLGHKLSQVHVGVDLDPAQDNDPDPPTGGDWYRIVVDAAAAAEFITIGCAYDLTDGFLGMLLYDSAGNELEEAMPVAGGVEIANYTLAEGTYHICIFSYEVTVGQTYDLQWLAGTGGLDIYIE